MPFSWAWAGVVLGWPGEDESRCHFLHIHQRAGGLYTHRGGSHLLCRPSVYRAPQLSLWRVPECVCHFIVCSARSPHPHCVIHWEPSFLLRPVSAILFPANAPPSSLGRGSPCPLCHSIDEEIVSWRKKVTFYHLKTHSHWANIWTTQTLMDSKICNLGYRPGQGLPSCPFPLRVPLWLCSSCALPMSLRAYSLLKTTD